MKEVLVVALEVLIADEDQYVAVNLKHILEEVDNVKVVAIANDGKNAVSLVEKLRPQVVCLDIDIPEMNGIEVARELTEVFPNLNFVFISAYPNFALEAFELYSFDYILKPLDEKRVKKTVRKLKEKVFKEQSNSSPSTPGILIEVNERNIFLNFNEIIFIESRQHKILIKSVNGAYLTNGDLHTLEQKLDPRIFFRCHKGFIVNLMQLKEVVSFNRTFEIILRSGDKVSLSREKEKVLRDRLKIC
ncbi:MAG: LytTR family DNA-binding domain-containing protein [Thermincola sp.]|nr:LytTR family DNA-binding domain-containing protein [Thermincola sp.]